MGDDMTITLAGMYLFCFEGMVVQGKVRDPSWQDFPLWHLTNMYSNIIILEDTMVFLKKKLRLHKERITKAVVDMPFVNIYVDIRNILTYRHKSIHVDKSKHNNGLKVLDQCANFRSMRVHHVYGNSQWHHRHFFLTTNENVIFSMWFSANPILDLRTYQGGGIR